MPPWHSAAHWSGTVGDIISSEHRTLLGKFGDQISYDSLSEEIKSDNLRNELFPSTITIITVPSDLGMNTDTVLSHIQTRSPDFNWQTYISFIPGNNSLLSVTHALSKQIGDSGIVSKNGDGDNDPNVTLNHLPQDKKQIYIDYLKEAYQKNDTILNHTLGELSKVMYSDSYEFIPDTKDYTDSATIETESDSIYHYHGSCGLGEVVNSKQQMFKTKDKTNVYENVYVADASVYPNSWGGSTSVPAVAFGYRVVEEIASETISLNAGWNLVSFSSNGTIREEFNSDLYTTDDKNLESVYTFDNENKKYIEPENTNRVIWSVIKNKGYWINVKSDGNIVLLRRLKYKRLYKRLKI